jgi:hypothetical protein
MPQGSFGVNAMSHLQTDGAAIIAAERHRQIDVEGWSHDHDDRHSGGELLRAAIAYLEAGYGQVRGRDVKSLPPMGWPFEQSWWKPKDAERNLARAGAFIAAEIDRLRRMPRPIYRVQLEAGVWLSAGYGDPPRTCDPENAASFTTRVEAEAAKSEARCYRPFVNAVIQSSIAPLGGKNAAS